MPRLPNRLLASLLLLFTCLASACGDDDAAAELSATECSDGADNDGDGQTDCDDIGCAVHAFCESGAEDGGARDAGGLDAAASDDAAAPTDGGADGSSPMDAAAAMDASADAGTTMDASADAGSDGSTDAGIDAGTDAGIDAGTDAGIDAGIDAGTDAGPPPCPDEHLVETFEGLDLGTRPSGWAQACFAGAPYDWRVTDVAAEGTRGLAIDFRGSGGEAAIGVPVAWPTTGTATVSFRMRPGTTDQNIYVLPVRGDRRFVNAVPFQRTGQLGAPDSGVSYEAGRWYHVTYELDFDAERFGLYVDGALLREGPFIDTVLPCELPGTDYLSIHGGYVDQKYDATLDDLRITFRGPLCEPPPRYALRFDGDGDEVEFPMSFGDVGRFFTFEAWVKPTSATYPWDVGGHVFEHRADCQDFTLWFSRDERQRFGFHMYNTTGCGSRVQVEASSTSALDEWHHVAAVFDDGAMRIYVDGSLEGTATLPGDIDWTPPALFGHWAGRDGEDSRPTRGAFIGEIDAIRISDAARYSGATLAVPTRLERDADTIALWQLDEGAGATAADETTFMRDGTIRGAAWVPSDR